MGPAVHGGVGMATTTARLTPDDLLFLPDDGRVYELVDGELRERTVSKDSSRAGAKVVQHLGNYADATESGWVFGSDQGFRCFADTNDPDRIRKPDAAFVSLARMPTEGYEDEGFCGVTPDLVAEVISPNDLASEVESKRDEWLAAGVRTVWILDPDAKTVRVHRADGGFDFLRRSDTLTDADVLPGFSVRVGDLFRRPSPKSP